MFSNYNNYEIVMQPSYYVPKTPLVNQIEYKPMLKINIDLHHRYFLTSKNAMKTH